MKKFNQDRDRNFNDRSSNRRSGGFDRNSGRRSERGGFGGGSRGGASMMHKAICFECSKDCEVPFRPTGNKPVFCSTCFGNKRSPERRSGERPERNFERGDSFKSRFDDNKFGDNKKIIDNSKMDEIVSRLDKIIKLLTPAVDLKKEEPQLTKTKTTPNKKIEKINKIKTKTKNKK